MSAERIEIVTCRYRDGGTAHHEVVRGRSKETLLKPLELWISAGEGMAGAVGSDRTNGQERDQQGGEDEGAMTATVIAGPKNDRAMNRSAIAGLKADRRWRMSARSLDQVGWSCARATLPEAGLGHDPRHDWGIRPLRLQLGPMKTLRPLGSCIETGWPLVRMLQSWLAPQERLLPISHRLERNSDSLSSMRPLPAAVRLNDCTPTEMLSYLWGARLISLCFSSMPAAAQLAPETLEMLQLQTTVGRPVCSSGTQRLCVQFFYSSGLPCASNR